MWIEVACVSWRETWVFVPDSSIRVWIWALAKKSEQAMKNNGTVIISHTHTHTRLDSHCLVLPRNCRVHSRHFFLKATQNVACLCNETPFPHPGFKPLFYFVMLSLAPYCKSLKQEGLLWIFPFLSLFLCQKGESVSILHLSADPCWMY